MSSSQRVDRITPPYWASNLFVCKKSNMYDKYFLIWGDSKNQMQYEVMLDECDAGFQVIFGSCLSSYCANYQDWNRVNMGFVKDWEALRLFILSLIGENFDKSSIWNLDSIKQRAQSI